MEEINWDYLESENSYFVYFGKFFSWSQIIATVRPFEAAGKPGWLWEVRRRNGEPGTFGTLLNSGFNHKVVNVTRAIEYHMEEAWRADHE